MELYLLNLIFGYWMNVLLIFWIIMLYQYALLTVMQSVNELKEIIPCWPTTVSPGVEDYS